MESLILNTHRLVHLDLKGAPPKVSYLEKLIPLLKEWGATGVLLEWEDAFPYSNELCELGGLSMSAQTNGYPYTVDDARAVISIIKDCGLIIIPLVQTFGHMEFLLKHEQWHSLREVPEYPSSMCPSHEEAFPVVKAMLRQIITFHGDLQYLHIGCDEVWHMGLCTSCLRRVQGTLYGKFKLFLDHVTAIAQFLKACYPHITIIIWDDMVRNIPLNVLQEYNLGSLVEPMVWMYVSKDYFQLGPSLWDKYANVFQHVWVASAFKGATGSCQTIPDKQYHVSNHDAWLTELSANGGIMPSFRGIAITGWSRYDHYATVCELLPVAIPSLALCLKTWLNGGYTTQVLRVVGKTLGYEDPSLTLETPSRPYIPQTLNYPGSSVSASIEWLMNIKFKVNSLVLSEQLQTWLNPWQVQNNYTNPMQIENLVPALTELLLELNSLENNFTVALNEFCYLPTIKELVGTLIMPVKNRLQQIKQDCVTQLELQPGSRTSRP